MENNEQSRSDPTAMDEFLPPDSLSPSAAALSAPEHPLRDLAENTTSDGQDIFGNTHPTSFGYDLSIDETSLLYH
ncbi:unnamed protein product [Strongylus vulgaris]|uniref:Uncharacterized protein n=1 Tax=Strongylus vulgaris TaxID=40348 RepID=A0A3P7ISA8_STRVU|nr:unnamed protein product [Strongylus vulgaris]